MAIQDITKPMALDETLQATNTALGNINTNILAISTNVNAVAKDTTLQATNTALGSLAKDATLAATNTALGLLCKDTTLQSIVTALASIGVNTVGNLASLVTTDKSSLVGAVNEVAGDVSDLDTDKADKVSGATTGNLASLDASGNLTDAGWASDKTTTSASGNPISISGLKSNQLAVNPIITLEPIQAGSGDPSPNNERPISGYDKIEVLSCGKNLLKTIKPNTAVYTNTNAGQEYTNDDCCLSDIIHIKQGVIYYVSWQDKPTSVLVAHKYNKDGSYVGYYIFDNSFSIDDCDYVKIQWNGKTPGTGEGSILPTNAQVEVGSSATTYEPYNPLTDIQLTLGQTIYGGTLDVEKGILTVDSEIVDLSTISWAGSGQAGGYYHGMEEHFVHPSIDIVAEKYTAGTSGSNKININDGNVLLVLTDSSSSPTGKAVLKINPYTIQLTPREILLFKDYAYVSTNGTSISLDYHNGEMASLGDVAQLGQTVNELGNINIISSGSYTIYQYFNNLLIVCLYGFTGNKLPIKLLTSGISGVTQLYDVSSHDNVHANIWQNGNIAFRSSQDVSLQSYNIYGTFVVPGVIADGG